MTKTKKTNKRFEVWRFGDGHSPYFCKDYVNKQSAVNYAREFRDDYPEYRWVVFDSKKMEYVPT